MTRDEVAAEDINAMLCRITDMVIERITLTDQEMDELWELLQPKLEEFFHYPDYRHYN